MASYKVLEKDEHGYATHDIESDGYEAWIQNYYTEDGKFKDLRIYHSRVPAGYRSWFNNKVYEKGYDYYSKYNEKGEMIAEFCTIRFNGQFFSNWVYSNWHCGLNRVKGLTYQEYKDWCKEIGVYADESIRID